VSIHSIYLFFGLDVAFAERLMGQPTGDDNYRGYDVSRVVTLFTFSAIYSRSSLTYSLISPISFL